MSQIFFGIFPYPKLAANKYQGCNTKGLRATIARGPKKGQGLTGPEIASPAPHGAQNYATAADAKILGGQPRGDRVEKNWLGERFLWMYDETVCLRLCGEF